MRVLLVEDNDFQRGIFLAHIKSLGHEVEIANNAQSAIETIDPIGRDKVKPQFDAIITDMRMPGGSGWYLLQFLNRFGMTPPCLTHSSNTSFEDSEIHYKDLTTIQDIFEFAEFHIKDKDLEYIKDFLDSIQK